MPETKVCNECGEERTLDRFPKRQRPGGGRMPLGHCWVCHAERHRLRTYRWREKNKDVLAGYKLQERYGITLEQYNEMFARQDGRCAICHRPPSPRKKLGVDHDHETGIVRGLLCDHCNRGIANFGDDIECLLRAIRYLGGD